MSSSGKTPQSSGRAASSSAASSAMHPHIPRNSSAVSHHSTTGNKSSSSHPPQNNVSSPAVVDANTPRRTAAKRPPTSDSQSLETLNRQPSAGEAASSATTVPGVAHSSSKPSQPPFVPSLEGAFGETFLGVQPDVIRGAIQTVDSPISTSTCGPQVISEMYSNNYILIELEHPCVDAFNRGALVHSPDSKSSLERIILSKCKQRMEKSGSIVGTPGTNTQSLRVKAFKSSTTNWRGGIVKKSLSVKQSIEPAAEDSLGTVSSSSHIPLSNGNLPLAPHPSERSLCGTPAWPTTFQKTFRDLFTIADQIVQQQEMRSPQNPLAYFVSLLQYIIVFVSAKSSDAPDGSAIQKGVLGIPLRSASEGHVASETPLTLLTLISLLRYLSFSLDEVFFDSSKYFLANLSIQPIESDDGSPSPLGNESPTGELSFDTSNVTSSDSILPLYTSARWFSAFAPLQILHLARGDDGDFANSHLLIPMSSVQTSVETIAKLHNSGQCKFFFLCSSALPNFGCFLPFSDAEKIVEEFYNNILDPSLRRDKFVSTSDLSSLMTQRRVLLAPRFFPECTVGEYVPSPHIVLAYPDCLEYVLQNATAAPMDALRDAYGDGANDVTWVFQPSATCVSLGTMIPSFDQHVRLWSHYNDLVCSDYVSAKQALIPETVTERVCDPPGGYFSMTIPVLEL